MKLSTWAKAFEDGEHVGDIAAEVRELEVRYWVWLAVSAGVFLCGCFLMVSAPEGYPKQMFIGLFLGVDGAVALAAVKLWAHTRLAAYQVLRELRMIEV